MKQQVRQGLLLFLAVLLTGAAFYLLLFHLDNKYTAALPGGYGYNVLQDDPDTVGFLVDGWEIYPGQLLEPSDFSAGIQPESYTYIGEYPNFSAFLQSPYGVCTYRIILENHGDPVQLAFYLPELLSAGRIYINGTLADEQGCLSPYKPHVIDGVYSLTAEARTEIVIQCANYTHYYSGMYYPPAIGTLRAVSQLLICRFLVYGFLCFTALAISLLYLIQWLPGRDRLTRWMGLLSLAFALRVCYPFLRALGVPVVRPLYALEDVCGNLVLLCAILLAGELSGTQTRSFHRRFAVPAAVGLCVFTAVFPLAILPYATFFINSYGLILFLWKLLAALYLLFLAAHMLASDLPLGFFLLCADGLYGLSMAVSVITANRLEPIRGAWPEEYGGFALIIGFAALMIRRSVLMTRENQRLTLHLQEEVDRKTQGIEALLAQRRELLANLLHDVKNPLASLRSYAELVRSSGELDEETAAYLDSLTERVGVVRERFELIQDFSRGERDAAQGEKICLNTLLYQFHLCNRPDMELSGLHFVLRLPTEKLSIHGSQKRLWSVLENLCYNALSFTPEGGTITLLLRREQTNAVIAVSDTSSGIAPEDLPHVFERGFTHRADHSGDGLGLYLVHAIALEHGGTVDVQSQPGRGSQFTLRLPLA